MGATGRLEGLAGALGIIPRRATGCIHLCLFQRWEEVEREGCQVLGYPFFWGIEIALKGPDVVVCSGVWPGVFWGV